MEPWMEAEYKQSQVIDKAVETADRMICEAADGDNDTLLLYTTLLAQRFLDKVQMMASTTVRRKEFESRLKEFTPHD